LALTSTNGGSSVGIVRLQTKATEFVFCLPEVRVLSAQNIFELASSSSDDDVDRYAIIAKLLGSVSV
jgi:hypothetical protein